VNRPAGSGNLLAESPSSSPRSGSRKSHVGQEEYENQDDQSTTLMCKPNNELMTWTHSLLTPVHATDPPNSVPDPLSALLQALVIDCPFTRETCSPDLGRPFKTVRIFIISQIHPPALHIRQNVSRVRKVNIDTPFLDDLL
jgi:hypothetical protein